MEKLKQGYLPKKLKEDSGLPTISFEITDFNCALKNIFPIHKIFFDTVVVEDKGKKQHYF